MNERQAERLASNQTLFRFVNDEMLGLNEAFATDPESSAGFVCECSRLDCVDQVEIGLAEYTQVRSNRRWFVVAASEEHVFPEIEQVIKRADQYFVVEKLDVAGEVAEQAVEL